MVLFDFFSDYILEDEVVRLRPLLHSDFENLREFVINEPTIWKYSLVQMADEEAMRRYIDTALQNRTHLQEYPFIVFDKRARRYAGSTRFYDIQLENNTLLLGYTWYGEAFQGTGLNKHCKFLLLKFAFEVMGMERVEFRADNNNKRSIAAMLSIGCTIEGLLRSHLPSFDGKRRDSIILSILKEEWLNGKKESLRKKLTANDAGL